MPIIIVKGVSIYSQYLAPRSPNSLPWAYLSGENLLSQILSIDDRMEPPKGGPAHLGGAEHMRIQSAIMNLGPPKYYVIKLKDGRVKAGIDPDDVILERSQIPHTLNLLLSYPWQ